MTRNDVESIHNTLKNAIGYDKDFKVEINENSMANLDVCIEKLKNMIQKQGIKLPTYMDIKLPSIDKYDKLEWITKVTNIVELSNRLAKIPNIPYVQKKMCYAIKILGIDALSRANVMEEITARGGGKDYEKNKVNATYTIQLNKYNEKSVISWHLREVDANSDFAHLVDPENGNYKEYNGRNVEKYCHFKGTDFKLAKKTGNELRYNEKGLRSLAQMLTTRGQNKENIERNILQNFPALGNNKEGLEKTLNGRILEQEEEICEQGGYSGVKVLESFVQGKINEIYKKGFPKANKAKFNKIRNKFKNEDNEKYSETVYLINKILDTTDFKNVDFNCILKTIETKVDMAEKIPRTFGTLDELGEKYEMICFLETLGNDDFEKNICILNAAENQIRSRDFKPIGSTEQTFEMLVSIKQHLKDVCGNEKTAISANEIREFVDAANCKQHKMLEAVECMTEYVSEKDNDKLKSSFNKVALENPQTSKKPSKGILDLKKKMMKGEFIGGGRY